MDAAQVFLRILKAFETGELLGSCAWCGRVRIDGAWFVPSRAVVDAAATRYALTHSICDDCAEAYQPSATESVTERTTEEGLAAA
jgi:hypothetical protein